MRVVEHLVEDLRHFLQLVVAAREMHGVEMQTMHYSPGISRLSHFNVCPERR